MLLWPVYPPKRGQSTGRSVNPAFEAGNAAIQGPGRVWDGLLVAALPTSAIVNPKCRTENFCFDRSLRLKSRWRSALRHYNRHHRNAKCSFSGLFLENYWRARCYPSAMYIVFSILALITSQVVMVTHKKHTLRVNTTLFFNFLDILQRCFPPSPADHGVTAQPHSALLCLDILQLWTLQSKKSSRERRTQRWRHWEEGNYQVSQSQQAITFLWDQLEG